MRATAHITLRAAIVAATLFAPATPAGADPGYTFHGGCAFLAVRDATLTNGEHEGVEFDAAFAQHANLTPSGATLDCWIDVNGVEQPGTRLTTHVPGGGSRLVSYSASDTDAVALCQEVTFDDGSSWVGPDGTNPDCPATTSGQIPPQAAMDLLNVLVVDELNPTVCPILVSLGEATGGGVRGVVTIDPDGDVEVADPLDLGIDPVQDCPPYRTAPGPGSPVATLDLSLP